MWRISHKTITELYQKYIKTYPVYAVSMGTFFSLRPFYVRGVTTRDVEVCCCKLHLHARWTINALLACLRKHGLDPKEFSDYYSFFEYLTADCVKDEHAHISWKCTPNKSSVCSDITGRWLKFVDELSTFVDVVGGDDVTVHMEHFEGVSVKIKCGDEKKRLKQVSTDANVAFIITFLSEQLAKIIHHRNEFKNFRSVVSEFNGLFKGIYLDLDYAENLTIPMKEQPQSMYWTQETDCTFWHIKIEGG